MHASILLQMRQQLRSQSCLAAQIRAVAALAFLLIPRDAKPCPSTEASRNVLAGPIRRYRNPIWLALIQLHCPPLLTVSAGSSDIHLLVIGLGLDQTNGWPSVQPIYIRGPLCQENLSRTVCWLCISHLAPKGSKQQCKIHSSVTDIQNPRAKRLEKVSTSSAFPCPGADLCLDYIWHDFRADSQISVLRVPLPIRATLV